MALIACPECGKEVSDKAAACPYCGNPLKENPETEMSTKADAVSAAQKKNYFKWSLLLWPLYVAEMIVFVFVQLALGLNGKIEEIVYLGILGLITAVNFVFAIPLIRGMVKDNYLKTQSNKISIKGVISLVLCALFLVTSGKSMITSVRGLCRRQPAAGSRTGAAVRSCAAVYWHGRCRCGAGVWLYADDPVAKIDPAVKRSEVCRHAHIPFQRKSRLQ